MGTHTPTVAPWRDVLRRLAPVRYGTSSSTSVRWLNSSGVLNDTTPPETWRHVAEALDIMALLAQVAPREWKREVKRLWPSHAKTWRVPSIAASFEIGVIVSQLEVLTALAERVLDTECPRQQYVGAREGIVTFYLQNRQANAPNHLKRPRIPLHIVFHSIHDGETITRVLFQALQIVASQSGVSRLPLCDEHVTSSTTVRALFEATGVEFDHRVVVNITRLQYLDKIAQLGVSVHSLPTLDFANVSHPSVGSYEAFSSVETLQRLVAGIGLRVPGIPKLTISSQGALENIFRIMTAAQVNKSLKEVFIDSAQDIPEAPDRADNHMIDFWRCIAYTIFSPHAEHSATDLKLELRNFRAEYVDAIRDVLRALRPVSSEDLGAGVFDRLLGRCSTRLTCSKVFLFDPKTADQARFCYDLPVSLRLRVIQHANDEDFTTVLLPGWGTAWAVERSPMPCANRAEPRENSFQGFKKVVIRFFDEASMRGTSTLFSLVGSNVDNLTVENANEMAMDERFADVSPFLPQLQRLSIINSRIASLTTLIQGMTSSNMMVTCLVLDDIQSDADEFNRFFNALGDPSHRLCTQLGELHMIIQLQDNILQVLVGLSDALHANRRLHTLRLGFIPTPTPSQRDDITRQLSPHLKSRPMCRVAPLGIREKLAFLSVVIRADDTLPASALQQLDTTMVANIIELAGHGVKRDVQITFAT